MPAYLTPEQVSDIFSRTRIPPPKEILMPINLQMVSGDGIYSGRKILGLHKTGDNRVMVPATSPQRTLLHESIHNLGITGETPTRIGAAFANMRMNYGILPRITRRNVKYRSEVVPDDQVGEYMEHYGLSGDSTGVKMVRMVLEG